MTKKLPRGKNALARLYRGVVQPGRPLLFLDLDNVICLSDPYGGYDVFQPAVERPSDLWTRLWSAKAKSVLQEVARDSQPYLILTTSWLRMMDLKGFADLFEATGLEELVPLLHLQWRITQQARDTRWRAIERWLAAYYEGQPLLVVDDAISGSGLIDSPLYHCGRVLLCERNIGLVPGHLPHIRTALRQPA